MVDKLMYCTSAILIHKITRSVTQLLVETFGLCYWFRTGLVVLASAPGSYQNWFKSYNFYFNICEKLSIVQCGE